MEVFGLDIGSHRLKIVQLRRKDKNYELVALGSAPSTAKGLFSDAESDLTALSEAIKKLYQEARITTQNVVTALPQDQVFTRVITMPQLSEEEMSSAIKWEAEQYVPIPLSEVTLAHQVVGKAKENMKEKVEVLLVAAPTKLVNKLIKVLEVAGLNAISVEAEILALIRALIDDSTAGAVLLVDSGAKATDLAIVQRGNVVFSRSIPTAGEALTRAIATGLGLGAEQAEAYKKAYGFNPEKLKGKVVQTIEPMLNVVVQEMEKAIQFYQSESGEAVSRVLLAGGTAAIPEAASFFAQKLNLEVQLGNPFSKVIKSELLSKIPNNELPLYTIAVGLAMKEVE
jgi:type IV pilus assembly protein PilM